jgi:thiol-disulfide isomerase/thioredoxin
MRFNGLVLKNIFCVLLSVLFFNSCLEEKKVTSNGKQIWAKPFINQQAPELVVEKWLSEKPNISGKFVLVDFWATWCGSCREVIPELNAFQKEFEDDLIIIGLSDESEATINKFKNPSIEYFKAIDTEQRMINALEVSGIPHCIIINPQGIVVWEGWPKLEGFELTSEVIKDLIKK